MTTQCHNNEPLVGEFVIHRSDKLIRLELHQDYIKMYYIGTKNSRVAASSVADLTLNLNDVAGSSVCKGKEETDATSYFTIYAYIKPKKTSPNERMKRKRKTFEFEYAEKSTYDENFVHVNKWHLKLYNLLMLKSFIHQQRVISGELKNEHRELALAKPFLVFVNPRSGASKAKNIYFERAVPVWAEANIPDNAIFTQHPNFAREYVRNLNLEDYSGIVVVSGDGLVYEVINGLMERPDWRRAIKLPIAQIPGGSANALACCVAYLSGEVYDGLSLESFATQAAFNLAKSKSLPLDLVRYELCDKSIVYSFLALEWAMIADVDLESEKYRYLGAFRFIVGAIKRIYTMRIYRGKISFLLADNSKPYEPKNKSIKVTRLNQESKEATPKASLDGESEPISFKYLPPIDQPLSGNDWYQIEENFVFFLVAYMPLIASDFLAAPEARFDDGCMHLLFIREGVSRAQLFNLFQSTSDGSYLQNDLVEQVKVKAFRLEPVPLHSTPQHHNYQSTGVLMVDGEQVPYGPIQGEIMPSVANILANMDK